jgi:hypothetical protein
MACYGDNFFLFASNRLRCYVLLVAATIRNTPKRDVIGNSVPNVVMERLEVQKMSRTKRGVTFHEALSDFCVET